LIGFGYWGPTLLRNFQAHPKIDVKQVCDRNAHKLQKISGVGPDCGVCYNAAELLDNPEIDVVAIATQAETHSVLAEQALLRNKHVFVEKPFTLDIEDAKRLIQLARERNLIIMVDHPHLFQPDHAVVKRIIESGEIGKVLHYHSTRADFGLFQTEANVLWHTLYHDIYIIRDLFPGLAPLRIKASGYCHIVPGVEDTAIVSMAFCGNLSVDLVANWLFPEKERKIVIAGDRKLIHWDYTAPAKIRIFHKSAAFDEHTRRLRYELQNAADVPDCATGESLQAEVDYLVDCLDRGVTPFNDGECALDVMRFLLQIETALRTPGAEISFRDREAVLFSGEHSSPSVDPKNHLFCDE
jgi:predicted dehydrogenase